MPSCSRLNPPSARSSTRTGRELFLTASIGIATVVPGQTADGDLLRGADLAMYRAEYAGKDAVCVYDPTMHGDAG